MCSQYPMLSSEMTLHAVRDADFTHKQSAEVMPRTEVLVMRCSSANGKHAMMMADRSRGSRRKCCRKE